MSRLFPHECFKLQPEFVNGWQFSCMEFDQRHSCRSERIRFIGVFFLSFRVVVRRVLQFDCRGGIPALIANQIVNAFLADFFERRPVKASCVQKARHVHLSQNDPFFINRCAYRVIQLSFGFCHHFLFPVVQSVFCLVGISAGFLSNDKKQDDCNDSQGDKQSGHGRFLSLMKRG